MTKEWADRNGIKSFADIAAKKPSMRLSVNQPANLQSTLAMSVAIFDAYGIKEEEVTKGGTVFRSNTAGGLDALRDGKVDVLINGAFVPTAEITDLARGRQLAWISGDQPKMKAAADRWGYTTYVVPKDAYPFIDKEEVTLTLWSGVLASSQTSEETIYKFMKALAANRDRVRSIHPSLAKFAVEDVVRNPTPLPMHPGAERFYREAGVLK
jgi:TRAP transporter TAXI family solute receptor